MLAIPSIASADVARCEASVTPGTTVKTATFTVTQPAQENNQWTRLWTHNYTVTVNADGTFSGTGQILGDDQNGRSTSFARGRRDGHRQVRHRPSRSHRLRRCPSCRRDVRADGRPDRGHVSVDGQPVVAQQHRDEGSVPVFTDTTTTTTESVKNHGQFVKAQGGGKIAAQACAGMPLNSTQGKN